MACRITKSIDARPGVSNNETKANALIVIATTYWHKCGRTESNCDDVPERIGQPAHGARGSDMPASAAHASPPSGVNRIQMTFRTS